MDKIAVLIPCYNEAQTIKKVVLDWRQALPNAVIYVYDNNSDDGTAAIANEAGAIVRYEHMQGKGNVVRRMFREIDAECYIMVDGDDTYPAEYGQEMVNEVLENGADMVVGDRLSSTYFEENKRPFHNFGNTIVRFFVNHLFKSDIKDIMTGYRAFSFQFVKTFPVISHGFEIETEMSIHAIDKNMYVKNIIVQYRDRPNGSTSKLNTYSDGIKVLKKIFNLYKDLRPFQFYGWIAAFLFLLTVLFCILSFNSNIKAEAFCHIPCIIIAALFGVSSLISFFSGLIIQTTVRLNRQRFESELHNMQHLKNENKNH